MRDVVRRKFWALHGPLLWSGFATAVIAAAYFAGIVIDRRQDAATIYALNAGEDRQVDISSASNDVLLARINELLRRDRFDEAYALLDAFSATASTPASDAVQRADAIYNIANYRIRRATEIIRKGDFDGATALVNIAKSEYRIALRQRPDNWDFKHNLDVAMRMVRDLPQSDSESEEVPPDAPTRVWTDLPGVPKGLP